MANIIKPKRSSTSSSAPTTSDLADGEIAVNTADQKIYMRSGGSIVTVGNAGSGIDNISEDTSPQLGGDLDTNGSDITFGDNDKTIFGDDSDLQIFHNSGFSKFVGSGQTYIQGSNLYFKNGNGNQTYVYCANNGGVSLKHGASSNTKLATTSSGIDVTGKVAADSGEFAGNVTLTSTDAGSSAAPEIDLVRNSASPADADYLGQIKFTGENDADQSVLYAKITGKSSDVSDGTEDGLIEYAVKKAGSNTIVARLTGTAFQLLNSTGLEVAGNITVTGNVDGRDVATDGTKLDGIEASADVTDTANVVSALTAGTNVTIAANGTISSTDTNTTYSVGDGGLTQKNFTTTLKSKLDGIESNATADQTAAQILTAIKTVDGGGSGLDADTLDGLQASVFARADETAAIKSFTSTLTKDSYTRIARITGDSLSTAVRVYFSGTANAIVVNAFADILVNHSGDIQISSNSSDYTALTLKVEVNEDDEDYDLYVKHTSGATGLTLSTTIHSIGLETITPNPTATAYSGGTSAEHTMIQGGLRYSQSSNNVDIYSDGDYYSGTSKVWHAGNDGSGSGLDADTVDGIQASSFLRSNANDSHSGILTLDVVEIGNEVRFPTNTSLTDVSLTHTTDQDTGFNWSGSNAVNYVSGGVLKYNLNNVWHSGNDGSGSGLDADKLDGQHGSYYYAASNPNGYTSNVGDITGVTAGTGLSGGGNSGAVTLNLSNTMAPAVATELSSSVDLDTLNGGQAGFYYQSSNSDTSGNNYPNAHAGSLIVQKSAGNATQLYQTYSGSPELYFRSNYTSGYTSWRRVWTSGNDGSGSGLDADLLDGAQGSLYARLANPTFTGTPDAPTASTGTNTTQLATTAFVQQEINALKALLYAYDQS